MAEFSVKDVAFNIGTSTQYVYQQVPELVDKGMAYRDKKDKPVIYESGLNFLMEKRKTGLQVANKGLQSENVKNEENTDTPKENSFASNENLVAELYKKLYEEQKEETKYWREKFEEKDRRLTELTSGLLLNPAKEEEQKSQKKKWGFFWNKN